MLSMNCSVDFSDYGNDVRDFLKHHSMDELLQHIDSPWLEVLRAQAVSTMDPHLASVYEIGPTISAVI